MDYFGLIIVMSVYLFDAFVVQYISSAKATKALRTERNQEFCNYSEWQTHATERRIFTVVFWALGIVNGVIHFFHIGFFGFLLMVYCFGALPWIYYYDLKKSWYTYYYRLKSGVEEHRSDFVIIVTNIFKPVVWFLYALIFYIKDFIKAM